MASRWMSAFALLLLVCITFTPGGAEEVPADSDQPVWKNGDLMPPLPRDEIVRAQAIARVEDAARARVAAQPGVHYLPPAQALPPTASTGVELTPGMSNAGDPSAARAWQDVLDRVRNPHAANTSAREPVPASDGDVALTAAGIPPGDIFGPQTGITMNTLWPASPDIAVGPERVVIVTTDLFQVRDRCGALVVSGTFNSMFGAPGFVGYDARVLFDEWHSRFVIAYIGVNDATDQAFVYMAASQNALGNAWWINPLPAPLAGNFPDDMSMSVSPTTLYLTFGEFDFLTFAYDGATLIEFGKIPLYNGAAVTLHARRNVLHPDASQVIGLRPATMHSYPGAAYFLASRITASTQFTRWTLTGSPGSSILSSANITGGAYGPAPNVQQPNLSLVRVLDCRIAEAVYDAGNVYGSFTSVKPAIPTAATANLIKIPAAGTTADRYVFNGPLNYMHPSFDVDTYGNLGVFFTTVSTSTHLSTEQAYVSMAGVPAALSWGPAFSGNANFTAGGAPHRWGHYTGCARDPVDDNTFWMHGAYATTPQPLWKTRVIGMNGVGQSSLGVVPINPLVAGGPEGGPFSQSQFAFQLHNVGPSLINWRLSTWPTWMEPTILSGTILPYSTEYLYLPISLFATGFGPGIYDELLVIENCTGTDNYSETLTLAIGQDNHCPGSDLYAFPTTTLPGLIETHTEPGVFVTAIEDVHLCALGMYAETSSADPGRAAIYEADGTTRGSLVYESDLTLLYDPNDVFHYIPVDVTLEACRDYELVLEFPSGWSYPAFDEALLTRPLDVGGALRIRDGSQGGNAAPNVLAPIVAVASPGTCPNQSDLATYTDVTSSNDQEPGIFFVSTTARRLCSVRLDHVAVAPGVRVTANLYNATGTLRQELLATGSAISATGVPQALTIPLSARVVEGGDYEIAVVVPGTADVGVHTSAPVPYSIDWMSVVSGSSFGFPHVDVPDMTVLWSPDVSGFPAALTKPGIAPPFNSTGALTVGAYITSLIGQEIYMLGIRADVPVGETVTANIYHATGTTRGALMTSGSNVSNAAGDRWHDVPVAATFLNAGQYDIEIVISSATGAKYWIDGTGLPFTAWNIQVRDAESFGVPTQNNLHHFRLHRCNDGLTPITDGPVRTPMFLANPVPNPASDRVRFGYSLESSGPASLAIYDVAGRLVARVVDQAVSSAGQTEIEFDASGLTSGVYFAKLTTSNRTLSRKFVIMR